MLPKGGLLVCTRCGEERKLDEDASITSVKGGTRKKGVVVLDDEEAISILPVIRVECSECGNMKAYWWLVQTRRADEPETRFLRCTKCKFTWREYD